MILLNLIQPGDWVYSIVDSERRLHYVVGVQGNKLKLRGFEVNGYYFNLPSFRKAN